ncbi:MAG: DUF4395 domain-containing protein [Nitrospirae bacterium]|nr:DUF4395 domain-containing protein [Nitrospirota bacterium]
MNTGMNVISKVIDQTELRVHQFFIIIVFLTAYVLDQWELVALQSVIFCLTFLNPGFSPYIALYRHVLQPTGLFRPDLRPDNWAAHRFASMIGLLVSASAAYLLATGSASIGWGLVWLIIVLAGIAFSGWCAGCYTYYLLNRLGLKGFFSHAPIGGAFPGARPPKANS